MQRRQFLSEALIPALAGVSVCGFSGCGAFIHPERCGQPHSNEIDWRIAALDGLGLLLFFIPGVVAFIVDFSTGAIYLPLAVWYPGYGAGPAVPPGAAPGYPVPPAAINPGPAPAVQPHASIQPGSPASQNLGLKRVVLPREQLQPQNLEQVVANHVGRDVSLDDSQVRLSQLARIDQFDEQASRHRSDRNFGSSVQAFFSRWNRV
jgi:hypothetical protein